MSLIVSTTGVDVEIPELGITIADPTADRDMSAQFNSDEISKAISLTTAIQSGNLTWKKQIGGVVETAADYDPDFTEVEELATGNDDRESQLVKRQGYRTSLEVQTSADAFSYQITKEDHHIHKINGGGPYTTQPEFLLPDATTLDVGHQYMVVNDSTGSVFLKDFVGGDPHTIIQTKRIAVVLEDNTTSAGVWTVLSVTGASDSEGVAPILGSYNGNAIQGRFLSIFPNLGSDEAPFLFATDAIVLAVVAEVNNAPVDGQIGLYEIGDLVTPRYTIMLTGVSEAIDLGLSIPFAQGEKLALKVNAGTTSLQKPRMTIYITGA